MGKKIKATKWKNQAAWEKDRLCDRWRAMKRLRTMRRNRDKERARGGVWWQRGIAAAGKEQSLSTREEKEDVTTRMQVQEIHISFLGAREKHREMDRGPFNLGQCCFLVKSSWHLSDNIPKGNLRTLVTDHTPCSEKTSQKAFKVFCCQWFYLVEHL